MKIKGAKTKESKFIPAADIQRILYAKSFQDIGSVVYQSPFRKEEKASEVTNALAKLKDPTGGDEKSRLRMESARTGHLLDAASEYAKLEKDVKEPAARRYFQYKQAEVALLQAKYDPTRKDDAIKALTDFKTNNREGWELLPVLDALAKLYEEAGKSDEARKAYEEIAELPGAPDAVKQQSGILVGKLYLRGKQYKEAEARLSKVVETMSGSDLQKTWPRRTSSRANSARQDGDRREGRRRADRQHQRPARPQRRLRPARGVPHQEGATAGGVLGLPPRRRPVQRGRRRPRAGAIQPLDAVRQGEEGSAPRQGLSDPPARQAIRGFALPETRPGGRDQGVTEAGDPPIRPPTSWPCGAGDRPYNFHTSGSSSIWESAAFAMLRLRFDPLLLHSFTTPEPIGGCCVCSMSLDIALTAMGKKISRRGTGRMSSSSKKRR